MQTLQLRWTRIAIALAAFLGVVLVCLFLLGYFSSRNFPSRFAELRGTYAWVDGDFVAVEKSRTSQQEGQRPPPEHAIGLQFKGRLGNLLFQYASLMGIAEANNLMPVIPESLGLLDYFDLRAVKVQTYVLHWEKSQKYTESKGCSFEPPVMQLGDHRDIFLDGYFQSWKYFEKITKSLQRQLTFKSHLRLKAKSQIERLTQTRCSSSFPACTFIGVHVRRGDMTSVKHFIDFGYVAAGSDYIIRAMNYFRSHFSAKERLLFLVVSDDPEWCRRELVSPEHDDVVVAEEKNSPAGDMAILAQMNHTVISQGSFGWWSAWMAGGSVTYWKDYPRPGSELEKLFTKEDYFFPSWTPL